MNSNENNNRYYNDYGYPNNNRQPNPYNGAYGGGYQGNYNNGQPRLPMQGFGYGSGNDKGNGRFVLGFVAGIALTALVSGFVYVGIKFYESAGGRNARMIRPKAW